MKIRVIIAILFMAFGTQVIACKYTIREIGYSTLNRVTYLVYRVNESGNDFPSQEAKSYRDSNIKTLAISAASNPDSDIVKFVKSQNVSLPAYVIVDSENRKLAFTNSDFKDSKIQTGLHSSLQDELVEELPNRYATVLLIEGSNSAKNKEITDLIQYACNRIEGVLPNMPKLVKKGPDLTVLTLEDQLREKILLWSLGIDAVSEDPVAFIIYGRGRIMGEVINYSAMKDDDVYKLLSIIGADCECGLDRKWMLGYQVPLDWPAETRQGLTDDLGFDVDNPMVLAEMSRILAIENRVPKDPSHITFEPTVINLDEEFADVPEINHEVEIELKQDGISNFSIILYSSLIFILLIVLGVVYMLRKNR